MHPGGNDDEDTSSYMADQMEANEKAREIEILQERIGKETDEKKRSKNIVIIGTAGVGKSSFANSVMASFSGSCWRGRAYVGYHGSANEQITHYLQSFCKDEYLEGTSKRNFNYPVLVDVGGFQNQNDELTKELLRIILFGRLPEEEKLMDAVKHHERYGFEGLRLKYKENDTNLKVDRIVFVASAKEGSEIPTNFIDAVVQVARKEDRVIPLFGVLTHKDNIDETSEEFVQKQDDFMKALGLETERYLLCTNYCEAYDRRVGRKRTDQCHPQLDIPIIQFMRQVCDNAYRVIKKDLEYGPSKTPVQPKHKQDLQEKPEDDKPLGLDKPRDDKPKDAPTVTAPTTGAGSLLLYAIKGVLIAILLFWLLKPPIEGLELSMACSKYENVRTSQKVEIDELTSICKRQKEITQREFIFPLMCFICVMVGVDFVLPPIVRKLTGLQL